MSDVPAVVALDGPVRPYAWGSRTLLAELRGTPPADGPEAEVWFGAHPSAPALARLPCGPRPLGGPGLPAPRFLLKLLAAGAPLSIQLHPDREAAAAGFAAEDAAGVPRDAAHRTYRDPYDKPELLRALTPMRLLVGARPDAEALAVVDALLPGHADVRAAVADGLRAAVAVLLDARPEVTDARLATLRTVVAAPDADDAAPAGAVAVVRELLAHHPADPGVLVGALLRPVDLAPGGAVFVPAGLPHAYLSGLGVEVMRASDNVVRGGLTSKHVDVAALVRLLDPAPYEARVATVAVDGWRRHDAPTDAFELREAEGDGPRDLPAAAGPRIVLCAGGAASVAAEGDSVALRPGTAAYVRPGVDVVVAAHGLVLAAA